jgi:hypothetical protein
MLLGERQLDPEHILESSKSRDKERHRHEKDQKPLFELGHENGFVYWGSLFLHLPQ